MTDDPFVQIDSDYSDAVIEIITQHESSMMVYNTILAQDINRAVSEEEVNNILSDFNQLIQVEREKYHSQLTAIESTRDLQKLAVAPSRDAQIEADAQAKAEQRNNLVSKLESGLATSQEVQSALAEVL